MTECFLCDEVKSGRLHAGVVTVHYDYRGGCTGCGGDVLFHEITGLYLGMNRDSAHVFHVWPFGYRCNGCGNRLTLIAVLCGYMPLDVSDEFKSIHKG